MSDTVQFIEPLVANYVQRLYYKSCVLNDSINLANGDVISVKSSHYRGTIGRLISIYEDESIKILNFAGSTLSPFRGDVLWFATMDSLSKKVVAKLNEKKLEDEDQLFVPVCSEGRIFHGCVETIELKFIENTLPVKFPPFKKNTSNSCNIQAGINEEGEIFDAKESYCNSYMFVSSFVEKVNQYLDKAYKNNKRDRIIEGIFNIKNWCEPTMMKKIHDNVIISQERSKRKSTQISSQKSIKLQKNIGSISEKNKKSTKNLKKEKSSPSVTTPDDSFEYIPSASESHESTGKNSSSSKNSSKSVKKTKKNGSTFAKSTPIGKAKKVAKTNNSKVIELGPMMHRNFEHKFIKKFIRSRIKNRQSGCLYVSGLPGTGKTATVQRVCARYSKSPGVNYIFLNGLTFTNANQVLIEICKKVLNTSTTFKNSLFILEKHFSSKKSLPTIIIVDEFDHLCSSDQSAWYNICEWCTLKTACIVFIAISNTFDLLERVMSKQVASRFGRQRLCFDAYTFDQLIDIMKANLSQNFEPDALSLVTRRIAAVSSDVRKCLSVCHKAYELSKEEKARKVTIGHVDEVFRQLSTSKQHFVKSLPETSRLFLESLTTVASRNEDKEASIDEVYNYMQKEYIANNESADSMISLDVAMSSAVSLIATGLISQSGSINTRTKLKSNFLPSDLNIQ